MSASRILYEFPHSHFCEVARWALDYKGLSYRRQSVFPGYHTHFVKKFAPESHLPLLLDNGEYIQGSSAILNHLEVNYPKPSIDPPLQQDNIDVIETDIASSIGVPLRRLCYAHLLDRPELVRYFFMHRSSKVQNLMFRVLYPVLSKRIRDTYDCTERGARSAQDELSAALDRYDSILQRSQYLAGDAFSRIDISFASLTVFIVMPQQYCVTWPDELKTIAFTAWFEAQKQRASYQFVQRLYESRHVVGEKA